MQTSGGGDDIDDKEGAVHDAHGTLVDVMVRGAVVVIHLIIYGIARLLGMELTR